MLKCKKLLALGLTGSIALTTVGCSSIINDDPTTYPLVSALTLQDVVDFYAEALKYDSVITRNIDVHTTEYEMKDITGDKKEKLESLTKQTETLLGPMSYTYSKENAKLLSEDSFNYIKATLNGNKLDNGEITSVKGALGYYFVDVNYDISPRTCGTFNNYTTLLGINGAFKQDAYGNDTLDAVFLASSANKLNEYYSENGIFLNAYFDTATGVFSITEGEPTVVGYAIPEDTDASYFADGTESSELLDEEIPEAPGNEEEAEVVDDDTLTDELEEDTEAAEGEELSGETEEVNTINDYTNVTSSSRKTQFDVSTFNQVIGSSSSAPAYMPRLDIVFNIPEAEGTIGGIGIYPSGANGLSLFGYDRSQISGTMTLRYVFKETVDGSGDIVGTNVYPVKENINTGFTDADSNVIVPEFLSQEFQTVIERADRATIDNLLAGLMGGNIYEDMGYAVLTGYTHNYANILKKQSTIRQIISRDQEDNSYLVEIETTTTEGAKSTDCYGTYRDKSYVVIQQQGSKFIITDSIRTSRELVTEPEIYPDSSAIKRVAALGLAGEVTDDVKTEVNDLMLDLYSASTARKLRISDDDIANGNNVISVNGKDVTLDRGMYDCFDSDTTLLSSADLEYMNSELRNLSTKYGTGIYAEMTGQVVEWMGGYDNQVEFITEELTEYAGKDEGVDQEVYYLVSNMNGKWVIDERKVLNEQTVTGSDLATVKERTKCELFTSANTKVNKTDAKESDTKSKKSK